MKSQQDKERAFWNRFAEFLRSFGVSEISISNQTAFAKSFVVGLDCRLVECDKSMVKEFFVDLGRDPSRSVVATSQAVDAVKYLLKIAKIPWAESFDWEGQKASFQTLPPSHPTRRLLKYCRTKNLLGFSAWSLRLRRLLCEVDPVGCGPFAT